MIKFLIKIFNVKFLLIFLFLFNEFTLEFFDKTPPLSKDSVTNIRKIQFLAILLYTYVNFIYFKKNLVFIHKKIVVFFKNCSFLFFLICIIDLTLGFVGIGIDKHWYDEDEIRYETPYDMFSNMPNINDHNNIGFRGPNLKKNIDDNIYSIAFLGGSTGYAGDPPIPEILSNELNKSGIKNIVFNFSSNSSNHNQHLHRLIKFINYKYDLIIFYGGNNESIQHLQYDPRVGYPYNYYMKSDLSELKVFLLKYSSIIGLLEKYFSIVTDIQNTKKDFYNNYDNWSYHIVKNYLNTLNNAENIFKNTVQSNLCNNVYFLPILQPVNPLNNDQQILWDKIILASQSNDNLLDYSKLKHDIVFYDNVHIDQASKSIIANKMSKDIKRIYNKNCN